MSLINEALKKAALETGPDDSLQEAYPQKLFCISGRQPSNRPFPVIVGAVVVAGLVVAAWQVPTARQRLFGLIGVRGPAPESVTGPAAPPASPGGDGTPAAAGERQPALVDRAEVERQLQAGVAAFQQHDLAAARSAFVAALKLDPAAAVARNGLGLVEKAEGRLDQAERHYLEAIRLAADYAEPHNNLALLYDQRGETDRALLEYSTALSLRLDYPEARLNYAIALEHSGRRIEAKREYQAFLATAPPALADVADKVKAHVATLPSR